MSIAISQSISRIAKREVEFHASRPYQPGDRWKDIDWKHSYMLDELITKEFSGAQGQSAILVADLTAKDAEDADKLAYNLVMSALTLTAEAIPTALAVYNHEEIFEASGPTNPRETLKKTLGLTAKIIVVEPNERVLQPFEIQKLNSSLRQLDQVNTESAKGLKHILETEFYANKENAKKHPATQALLRVIRLMQSPAVITVVSSFSFDSDALMLTLQQLQEKGFKTVMVA